MSSSVSQDSDQVKLINLLTYIGILEDAKLNQFRSIEKQRYVVKELVSRSHIQMFLDATSATHFPAEF